MELLKDEDLLRTVVEANGLAAGDRLSWIPFRDAGHEAGIGRAVRRLGRKLKTEPIHKTNLIRISFESSDPGLAERVLRSLGVSYIEKHKQVHRPAGGFPFFEQQVSASAIRLDEAESQLLAFSRNQGVVSGVLERDLALQKVSELDRQYQQVRVGVNEKSRRIEVLKENLAKLSPRSTSTIRTAENPQLMEKLKSKLLSLELRRTELLTKYEPSYRLVQEVDDQIAQTKAAIAAEDLSPPRDETTEKDPNYEWTKAELEKAEVELSALEANEETVAGELVEARAQREDCRGNISPVCKEE